MVRGIVSEPLNEVPGLPLLAEVAPNGSARHGYRAPSQTEKNLAWFLPRPKPDRYKGGMPLYAEEWLIELARDILRQEKVKFTERILWDEQTRIAG